MLLFPSSAALSRFPSPLTGLSAGLGHVPVRGAVIQTLTLEGTDSLVTMYFPGHNRIQYHYIWAAKHQIFQWTTQAALVVFPAPPVWQQAPHLPR